MATWSQPLPSAPRHAWKLGLLVLLRATLSVSVLFTAYFLIPIKSAGDRSDVPWLAMELCVFAVVVVFQVPAIIRARHPVARAVEAVAILVPVYLLIFARTYMSCSLNDPSAFTQPLDNIKALYFTVTVFATVGFGDIVAQTNSMRLLVTIQMLVNLVILGVVIRLLASAARRGVARRGGPDPGNTAGSGDANTSGDTN